MDDNWQIGAPDCLICGEFGQVRKGTKVAPPRSIRGLPVEETSSCALDAPTAALGGQTGRFTRDC